jgi:hypothetical protein
MTKKDDIRKYPFASRQVRRFVPWAKVSAVVLVATTSAVACIYGVNPLIPVSYNVRGLILLVWFWNVCISAVSSGIVLWGWLVDRYGDRSG